MTPTIRPATTSDIQPICDLVNGFAAQNLMLPRTPAQIQHVLASTLVAEADSEIVGCGYLAYLRPDLVEIRSLAVSAHLHGQGVGGQLLEQLVSLAEERGVSHICALTLTPDFFLRHNFRRVDRWSINPKIWGECVYCPKFHACDEIAVLRTLSHDS